MTKEKQFQALVAEVQACRKCTRMNNSERVISSSNGSISSQLMFVGEAPGRLGADSSHIPFHGDKSGHNFESLLDQVGLSRYEFFITNAVLCNPKDEKGNNATPTTAEIANCSTFLKRQIDLIEPKIVVTLGATALSSCCLIEEHEMTLRESVRTARVWNRRKLIPLYHPGPRALIHRSFPNQLADYQFVAESYRRLSKTARRGNNQKKSKGRSNELVKLISRSKPELSYFALHKLFFLSEAKAVEQLGERLTDAYIIRQKDGPYCVDLHIGKLSSIFPQMKTRQVHNKLMLSFSRQSSLLDVDEPESRTRVFTDCQLAVIDAVLEKYSGLSDSELKTAVYLNREMRKILKAEKAQHVNHFNTPLLWPIDH